MYPDPNQPPPLRHPPTPLPPSGNLDRVQALSNWLDNAIPIPGTGYRIGLDPIIGLLPGGGDTVTGLLSAYIVWEAARMGAPRTMLLRMAWNIALEVVLGSIPFVGDLFDATWKANAKNVRLLRQHLHAPRSSRRANLGFALLLIAALIVLILAFVGISIWVLSLVVQALGR